MRSDRLVGDPLMLSYLCQCNSLHFRHHGLDAGSEHLAGTAPSERGTGVRMVLVTGGQTRDSRCIKVDYYWGLALQNLLVEFFRVLHLEDRPDHGRGVDG